MVKKIEQLRLPDGTEPYSDWLNRLEVNVQARVTAYIDRVSAGGSRKNIRALGDGVFEIKIDMGPGYRVYFGELGGVIILLLVGGDKGTQSRDIAIAKRYWANVQK